jgi:hypothetical protein
MPSIPLALCLSCCTGPNFAITSTSQVPGSYDGFEHEGFGTKAAEVLSHGPETLPARTACNSNSVRHIFRLWGTLFCPVEFRLKAARRSWRCSNARSRFAIHVGTGSQGLNGRSVSRRRILFRCLQCLPEEGLVGSVIVFSGDVRRELPIRKREVGRGASCVYEGNFTIWESPGDPYRVMPGGGHAARRRRPRRAPSGAG